MDQLCTEDYELKLEVPASWEWSAAHILQRGWRKVLIIGATDRGKSTYCRFLGSRLLAAGCRVAIVDADIGQKDLGPPATITLGYPDPSLSPMRCQLVELYFIGAVSPVGHLLPMVVGTKRLVDTARAPFVLINTTGFVHDTGRVLKGYKIEVIRPDVIVAIEQGAELQALLKAYRNYRMLRLRSPANVITKTPAQRMARREGAFRDYFRLAREVRLPWRKLIFQRQSITPGCEAHLLCGIADRRNRGIGLAIIQTLDVQEGTLSLLTPVSAERIRIIQGGDLYLSPDGRELGRR